MKKKVLSILSAVLALVIVFTISVSAIGNPKGPDRGKPSNIKVSKYPLQPDLNTAI